MPVKVELHLFNTGFVFGFEALIVRGAPWRWAKLPCLVALIHHPIAGWGLFDTGYSPRFFEATQKMPYRIYRWLTPVEISASSSIVAQLPRFGLTPEDISWIFLSHLHGDHCCGVRDFPAARILVSQQALSEVLPLRGISALRAAYLPDLLDHRLAAVEVAQAAGPLAVSQGASDRFSLQVLDCPTFGYNVDLFGDGSCLAMPLPGHAAGQMGLLVQADSGSKLLAADAAWDMRAVTENRDVHPLVHGLVTHNRCAAKQSLERLQAYRRDNPETELVFSHCRHCLNREDSRH